MIPGHGRKLPAPLEADVAATLSKLQSRGGTRALWQGDASFWSGRDEAKWLGWVDLAERQGQALDSLVALREEVRAEGLDHALLLGMGGSSLCPEVLRETFGRQAGFPELLVLDSTDPAQVQALTERVDPARSLFIVSSKSGSTLEPNIFKAYCFDRAQKALGAGASRRFVAVTDPGSNLDKEARADGFRHVFAGIPSVGGRYSALSNFGLVPAAVMGLDLRRFLDEAQRMTKACAPDVPAADNPGLVLGAILGAAASKGIDKLTLVVSPGIYDLGAWLEQLVAESTGKEGKAIIPVDREALASPGAYGSDRLFAYLRLASAPDAKQDAGIGALEAAGHPVIRIDVPDPYAIAAELFRWEVATAVAGSVLGINPFDQPDVEASKVATRALTEAYEKSGRLPEEAPFFETGGIKLFADAKNAAAFASTPKTLAAHLKAHLARLRAGDYLAFLAYLPMNAENERALQSMRHPIRDKRKVATCLGFGPRFLHSTGQAYKGGPDSGVFVQITCDDALDLPVPGKSYSFGVVKAAQARGDFQVLADRGRRALRVHLGKDVRAGLQKLGQALGEAI